MKTLGVASPTAADVLQAGHWFLYASEPFEIIAWDSEKPLDVEARSANTGTEPHFTIMELFGAHSDTRFAPTCKELQSESGNLPSRIADTNTCQNRF